MPDQSRIRTPSGCEGFSAAIETPTAVLDAMIPGPGIAANAGEWEGDITEDVEEGDPAGGDICDEAHDQGSKVQLLDSGSHTTGWFHGIDQRFIQQRRTYLVMPTRPYDWLDAEYLVNEREL